MSTPKRNWPNKLGLSDDARRDFIQSVQNTIKAAGFKVRPEFNRIYDLSFHLQNGVQLAVECGLRPDHFGSERRLETWLAQLLKHPIVNTLIVARAFPPKIRDMLGPYRGIEMVRYEDLRDRLENFKYKPLPRPKALPRSARIASTVRENRTEIIIATEALALQIDAKLSQLKDQHPNDPETIAVRDSQISDYEALKAQVEDLKKAVAKLSQSAQSKEQAAEKAMSFRDGVQGWWNKQHVNILERSAEMGVVLSAVGVCHLLGVSPNMAMAAATALVGGKSVAKALKGVIKVNG
jgi:hypothetical protein